MRKKIYISGRVLTQKVTGVQRFAIEMIKALDEIFQQKDYGIDIVILVPRSAKINLETQKVEILKRGFGNGLLWEQFILPFLCRGKYLLCLGNTAPFFKLKKFIFILDASVYDTPDDFSFLYRLWCKLNFVLNSKISKHVFTISQFSKSRISHRIKTKPSKISVIPCAADHILKVNPDDEILPKLDLTDRRFVLYVGSISSRKNISYLSHLGSSLKTKGVSVVAVGKMNAKVFNNSGLNDLPDIIFTGYLADAQLVSLYKASVLFIYPSEYEGFGIPPMEAALLGAVPLVCDIEVMREVWGEQICYLNEKDRESQIINFLDLAFQDKFETMQKSVFKRAHEYNWRKSAQLMLDCLSRYI